MSTLAFVLFWVVVAIALVFVGLSGGARGARERLHTQTRRGRKSWFTGFGVALVLFGIVVPGLVIAAGSQDDTIPEAGITELTALEERGRELFAENCNNCHTLAATAGSASVGPNLDKLRPPAGLVLDAIENGRARGNGAMPADIVTGEDAEAVAQFVAKAVGQQEGEG